MHYRLRIDIVDGLDTDDLMQMCDTDKFVIVRHELPRGNPHIHAYIETNVKDNTLRLRFKRKYKNLKPSDYSIKTCDELRVNEYVQYMFNTKHGNVWELIDSRNFDPQLVNDLMEAAKKISTDYADVQRNKKSITIWDIAQEVEAIVAPQFVEQKQAFGNGRAEDFPEDAALEHLIINVYTDTAIQILRKYKKAFDEFLLRKVISTAMSNQEIGKDKLRKKMIKNFSSHY